MYIIHNIECSKAPIFTNKDMVNVVLFSPIYFSLVAGEIRGCAFLVATGTHCGRQ